MRFLRLLGSLWVILLLSNWRIYWENCYKELYVLFWMRKRATCWLVGVMIVLIGIFLISSSNNGDLPDSIPVEKIPEDVVSQEEPTSSDSVQDVVRAVDFESYNVDYMNDDVRDILVRKVGSSGKTAFYLPSTGYVNVSRGDSFGVAWLVQNVNPDVPDGNEFSFNFSPNVESLVDCGVSEDEAQGWIKRGWSSTGMISGQWREDWNEWYDSMTVYFSFPSDLEPCNVKYDFVILKDGVEYHSRILEFNLV